MSRLERKTNRILRTFIFKSGGKMDRFPESQALPAKSQDDHVPFTPVEDVDPDGMEVTALHVDCTMLADDSDFAWLFPWIFIVGELSVLGLEESDEGVLSKIRAKSRGHEGE